MPTNEIVSKRIIAAVTQDLQGKGFMLSDDPDLWVDISIRTPTKEKTTATSAIVGGFFGQRLRIGTGFSSTQASVHQIVSSSAPFYPKKKTSYHALCVTC